MKVFFWAHDIHFNETYTWREFNKLTNGGVTLVLSDLECKIRKEQGWKNVDISGFKIIVLPEKKWLSESKQIIKNNQDAIHIFSAFWRDKRFFLIILYALIQKIKVAIINEPYSKACVGYFKDEYWIISKIKVILRPLMYKLAAIIIKFIDPVQYPCILAVSLIARNQFIDRGFLQEAIFPFGYFIPKHVPCTSNEKKVSGDLQLIFLGSLIKRKGIDIAIQAIQKLNNKGFHIALDIFGHGKVNSFQKYFSEKIRINGSIESETAQEIIPFYDFLILPSRHDGWGVVVNEALMSGVPVITSDNVGAKCLFENQSAGFTFSNGNSDALMDLLAYIHNHKEIIPTMKKRALTIADNISPDKGAKYLFDIFCYYFYKEGDLPSPPWEIH